MSKGRWKAGVDIWQVLPQHYRRCAHGFQPPGAVHKRRRAPQRRARNPNRAFRKGSAVTTSQDALSSTFERRSPRTLYVQRGANALQGAGPRLQILSSHAESSASCLGSRVLPVVRAGRNATCLERSGVYRLLSQRGTGTYEGNPSRLHLFTAYTLMTIFPDGIPSGAAAAKTPATSTARDGPYLF